MARPRHDVDIREEMRIALFWRGLIGDARYNQFDPDDMLRWYQALELRGPDEIRTVRNERYFTTQTGVMQGLVARAPHPPLWLINEWLEHYEHKVRTGGYWAMAGCFIVITGLMASNLQGCANLQPLNPLVMNPPWGAQQVTPYTAPPTFANAPASEGIPASTPNTAEGPVASTAPPTAGAAPPATPTLTGPTSGGIAGAAVGAVPSAGVTGGQNVGISAGVQSGSSAPP